MTYTTTMTSKGQITVPAAFRKQLGMQSGKPLKVKLEGDRVIIQTDNWQAVLSRAQNRIAAALDAEGAQPRSVQQLNRLREQAQQQVAKERLVRSSEP